MFVGVRNNKTQQIRKINRIRTECCRISKIPNSVGRNDNFLARVRKLSVLPTFIDNFDKRQHYVRILSLYMSCAILEFSGTIPESADKAGIPSVREDTSGIVSILSLRRTKALKFL